MNVEVLVTSGFVPHQLSKPKECFTAPNFRGVYVGSAAGTLAALQLQKLAAPLCEELQVHQVAGLVAVTDGLCTYI